MNRQEAKRYAHKLTADAIVKVIHDTAVSRSPDAPKILKALGHIQETHARTGPRTGDKPPRDPVYTGEKLAFDAPEPVGPDSFGGTDEDSHYMSQTRAEKLCHDTSRTEDSEPSER